MLIDWFTVGAQLVNFIILVWLLKRFLYRPVLDAVAAREQRINAMVADADRRAAEASATREALEAERKAFEQDRAARLQHTAAEVSAARETLLEAARADAAALRTRLDEALRLERETRRAALGHRLGQAVLDLAGQVIEDLAGDALGPHIAARFLVHLRDLPAATRATLVAALAQPGVRPRVRTGMELALPMRQAFEQTLAELAPGSAPPTFEVQAELIGGVELVTDGHRFAWTVGDYLQRIEHLLSEDGEVADGRAGAVA